MAAVFGKSFWEGGLRSLNVPGDLTESLETLEQKDLLRLQTRSQIRADQEYAFKHDLIRDVAYETLPKSERRALHGRIADWLEGAVADQLDGYYDQLAYHAALAGQEERAVRFLVKAAERASRAAAHYQEATLLAQAIDIALSLKQTELLAQLRWKRGKAFFKLAMWKDALAEFKPALEALPRGNLEQRAELLVDIASVSWWLNDPLNGTPMAKEALEIAERLGRDELASAAMASLAVAKHAQSEFSEARELFAKAIARAGGLKVSQLAYAPHSSYVLGEHREAVELAERAVDSFRRLDDTPAIILALSHLGLNLASLGRYDEAQRAFKEARQFGMEREARALVARAISMSSAFHLDLYDFIGAEALAAEARDLARSTGFGPAEVSSNLDLLFNFIRRHDLQQAERAFSEFNAENWVGNAHEWLWKIRLLQARAEFALGRGAFDEALPIAAEAVAESRRRGRVKYEALGRWTGAQALVGLGRKTEALKNLQEALVLSRRIDDPALLWRITATLLEVEGSEAVLREAQAAAQRICAAISIPELRQRFETAEPVRRIGKST
jgi:tetratricopeptide (TPR) repeat protein